MASPEEAHDQHLKDLDEVLEETEECLERVQTQRFTKRKKQQAFQETVGNDHPVYINRPLFNP